MSVTLRTNLNCTEAVIADDGTLNLFYQVAGIITNDLRMKFVKKLDEFDSISWDFKFKGYQLTLHYNIYNGITVFPTRECDPQSKYHAATLELANMLQDKLFHQVMKKNIA